jgi:hypothetical protein
MALRGGSDIQNANVRGLLAIIAVIFTEVEVFGKLSKHKLLPATVTRKLTHIFAGSAMVTLLALFPVGESWWGICTCIHTYICYMDANVTHIYKIYKI